MNGTNGTANGTSAAKVNNTNGVKTTSANGTKATSPAPELRALADLINASVTKIEAALVSRSQTFPSSDESFDPATEAIRNSPDVAEETAIIVAAATQLTAAARSPPFSLMFNSLAFYISACIRVAVVCHIPEQLREAGPKGLHVSKLAESSGADPHKLARCLRLLATNYVFKEVAPDVFALNKVSSLLDTGKPLTTILNDVESKHDNTLGLTALIEHATDEGLKSAGWLCETLTSSEFAKSGDVNQTTFNVAFKTEMPIWAWFELPEQSYRLRRFAIAMQGFQNMGAPGALLEGFDWKGLPKGSVVVDVGGGVGSHTLSLYKVFDHLNFIVQDREPVIAQAQKYWAEQAPEAVKSGRVKLTVHDFFTEQPVKKPAVFLIRTILHDWSDKYSLQILRELRNASGSDTQLLIVDNTMSYACEDTTSATAIPGAPIDAPPFPLLANKGIASAQSYNADLHMLNLVNGCERTVLDFITLLTQTGWKLDRVYHNPGAEMENSKLIARPAEATA